MKFLLSVTFLASLLLANDVEAERWKPTQSDTWNIAFGGLDINKETAKIIEVDYNKSVETIRDYHNHGKKVICYFSGGTIEKNRPDYNQFLAVPGLVRNTYGAWPDERWLDYRVEGIKPLIKNRMREAIEKGCDAIDVDNVDGYQVKDVKSWSNPLTKEDAIKFTTWLGQTAHSLGISIGLKNCLDIIDTVGANFDFGVNEGCIRRNECYWYKNFLKTGKPILGITYNGLSANREALCRNLNDLPISMIIKPGSSLVQESIYFDGKKHCGANFVTGKVSLPSSSSNNVNTSTTTTQPANNNRVTTTVVRTTVRTTTTTTVVRVVPTVAPVRNNNSNSSNNSSSSNNNSNKSSSSNNASSSNNSNKPAASSNAASSNNTSSKSSSSGSSSSSSSYQYTPSAHYTPSNSSSSSSSNSSSSSSNRNIPSNSTPASSSSSSSNNSSSSSSSSTSNSSSYTSKTIPSTSSNSSSNASVNTSSSNASSYPSKAIPSSSSSSSSNASANSSSSNTSSSSNVPVAVPVSVPVPETHPIPTPYSAPVSGSDNDNTSSNTQVNNSASNPTVNENGSGDAVNDTAITNPSSVINGNDTFVDNTANQASNPDNFGTEASTAPVLTSISNNDDTTNNREATGSLSNQFAEKPETDGSKHTGTIVTGVAVTGSVLGAAAVFAFLKKNPKKYESLKRGISRRATSMRRGTTAYTRKLSTRRNRN